MVGFDTRIDIGIPAPQREAIAQGLSRSLARPTPSTSRPRTTTGT